jgi:hypothetical protein
MHVGGPPELAEISARMGTSRIRDRLVSCYVENERGRQSVREREKFADGEL